MDSTDALVLCVVVVGTTAYFASQYAKAERPERPPHAPIRRPPPLVIPPKREPQPVPVARPVGVPPEREPQPVPVARPVGHEDVVYRDHYQPPVPQFPPPRRWPRPPSPPPANEKQFFATAVAPPRVVPAAPARLGGLYDAAHGTAIPNADEDGVVSCVVCLDNIANVLFKPCCHQVTCTACVTSAAYATRAHGDVCPVCKAIVESWVVMPPLRTAATHPPACQTWGTNDENAAETAGRFRL
jgi:hypothetical protein